MAMLSVAEAQQSILAHFKPLEAETVPLLEALDRILAGEVVSDLDLPPFDNSAMDGYAVRADDIATASAEQPVRLPVVADIPAGHPSTIELQAGTVARITTGAMLPPGADTVVPVEDTDDGARGAGALLKSVAIYQAFMRGAHVRPAGGDVKRGERVLSAGTLIRPAE